MTSVRRAFIDAYQPKENLSIDEGGCPWRGRLSWKVFNPHKPNKFVMKTYAVAEAESGWIAGFDIYTGTSECAQYSFGLVNEEASTTTKIVIGLLAFSGLLSKGHRVFMDNYYSSPELFFTLESLDTYACGTVRLNRKGLPMSLKRTRLRQGQGTFRRNGSLLALKYRDKRDVSVLTTIHDAKCQVFEGRRGRVLKPTCIVEYSRHMGGVDLSDQLQQYYGQGVFRKTNKYWKKLFFYLINLMITNAFILHKKYGENRAMSHNSFRMSIVKALLEEADDAPTPAKRGRKSNDPPPRRLTERHFPSKIPIPPESTRTRIPLHDCVACNVPRQERIGYRRRQTSFECASCQVALCVPDCFTRYHTLLNFHVEQ